MTGQLTLSGQHPLCGGYRDDWIPSSFIFSTYFTYITLPIHTTSSPSVLFNLNMILIFEYTMVDMI